ncbi:hypothetical protein BASA50_000001, partial [Batrachochytrium salamandrivorans]
MMKIWVNSDSKQSHYSGKANPYPDLDKFRKTYAGMTDEQFNLDLTRIFNRMRDNHTLYYKAGPYGCFSVSTGLFFKFVDDSLGSSTPPKVRVTMITDTPGILGLIGNWYDQNKFILGFGANDSGGQRGAFQYLAEISGDSNILPEYDSITFQLRRLGGNQELYSVTVPYVSLSNDECWDLSSSLYKELNSIALPEIPALQASNKSGLDLLVKQLKDTDSVLFDVRGNGGGLVSAADGIIQLFKSDATASQFRYLKNDVTKSLFYNGLKSKIHGPRRGMRHQISVVTLALDQWRIPPLSNTFGQAYFNPVGVYTNGVCYSACEIFAAHIQDHDPFKEKLTGKTSSQKFYTRVTVGARQLIRSGNYAGELVEDNGVKSDVIVRSTIADILPGDRGASNYDRIANYLGDVAKRQADSKIYFISEPYDRVTFEDSTNILFVASGVDEIMVVYQGEELGSWKGESLALQQTHVITVKTPKGLQDHLVTFIGTKQGEQMFKTQRQITRIPTSNDRVSMMTVKSYTVLGPSSSTGVYSFGSMSEKDGWIFNDGKWTLGDGISDYSGRVESYKYLGVLIDSKLDHSAWLKQKRSALEHTISALHPVLANHQLTVNYRSRIFSAVVMGKAYYELELVGGNKSHLAPLKTTINKGIRLFTGARLSTAIGPLLVETGIEPLLTCSLVSRVRLLERSVTKRTPINAICSGTDNTVFTLNVQGQLVRSQRWFWSRRTKQLYRNRYWLTPQ